MSKLHLNLNREKYFKIYIYLEKASVGLNGSSIPKIYEIYPEKVQPLLI